jgi:hypothetical protein
MFGPLGIWPTEALLLLSSQECLDQKASEGKIGERKDWLVVRERSSRKWAL